MENQQNSYKPSEYVAFPVNKLVDNSRTAFDVFVNVGGEFVLYSGSHYKWERDELSSLLQKGFFNLYIRRRDLKKAENYYLISLQPKIDKQLAPPERIKNIEQVGMQFVKLMHHEPLSDGGFNRAEEISEAIVECMLEEPACIKQLSGLGDFDMYTYFHSVRVACYSVAIAHRLGMTSAKDLSHIGLGGMMHDIGKKEIDLSILNKQGALTSFEWNKIRSHPQIGYQLIQQSVLHHVPREIILHHHEKMNGSGYPHGLGPDALIDEVRIATLADIFDALTSSRSYQNKRSRFEALQLIKQQMLGKEVDPEVFKGLVQCLSD